MTQKAQLRRYAEDGDPAMEPSTPVIITGGGPVIDDDATAGQVVKIGTNPALPFKVAQVGPAADTWVASESVKLGRITQVTVDPLPPIERLTHPVVLSFMGADGRVLLEISEAGPAPGAQLTISVFDGAFEVKTPGPEPSTWLDSNILPQNAYAKLVINGDRPLPLSASFTVNMQFDQV